MIWGAEATAIAATMRRLTEADPMRVMGPSSEGTEPAGVVKTPTDVRKISGRADANARRVKLAMVEVHAGTLTCIALPSESFRPTVFDLLVITVIASYNFSVSRAIPKKRYESSKSDAPPIALLPIAEVGELVHIVASPRVRTSTRGIDATVEAYSCAST